MNTGFIKLMRTEKTLELMKNADAFLLASIMAIRARRSNDFNVYDLKAGESLLGDYRNYGMTERRYRTAKDKLKKWSIATFRTTTRGTIAKLCQTDIYDINAQLGDEQNDERTTNKRRTDDEQETTNKNYNNEKKEKNGNCNPSFSSENKIKTFSQIRRERAQAALQAESRRFLESGAK